MTCGYNINITDTSAGDIICNQSLKLIKFMHMHLPVNYDISPPFYSIKQPNWWEYEPLNNHKGDEKSLRWRWNHLPDLVWPMSYLITLRGGVCALKLLNPGYYRKLQDMSESDEAALLFIFFSINGRYDAQDVITYLTVRYNSSISTTAREKLPSLLFWSSIFEKGMFTRNLCCTYLTCPGTSQWLCFWLMEMVVPTSALFAFCKTHALPLHQGYFFLLLVSVSLWTQPQEDFYFSFFLSS